MKLDAATCPAGHDMRQPGASVQITASGYGQCRLCRNAKQRERGRIYTRCVECGREHPASTSQTCSRKCQDARQASRRAQIHRAHARHDHTEAILRLCDRRERATVHWERDELTDQIQRLQQLQQAQ